METGRRKKWSRVIAMMLAMVMVMQNVVTVSATMDYGEVFSSNFDENTGNSDDTVEGNEEGQGGPDVPEQSFDEGNYDNTNNLNNTNLNDTNPNGGGAGINNTNTNNGTNFEVDHVINSSASQTVVQRTEADGTVRTYIRYQVDVTNATEMPEATFNTEAEVQAYEASYVATTDIKLLLPTGLSYADVAEDPNTAGIISYNNAAEAAEVLNDVGDAAQYAGPVYVWAGQTLNVNETKQFVAYALVEQGVTDAGLLTAGIYANGQAVGASWVNAELLTENTVPEEPQDDSDDLDDVGAVITAAASQSVMQDTNEDGTINDTYIRYQISVQNTSVDAAAENTVVNLELPATLTYAQYPGATDETAGITADGNTLSWTVATLDAQGQMEFVCYALAEKGATDEADLTAAVSVNGEAVELAALDQDGVEMLAGNVDKADTDVLDDIIEKNKEDEENQNSLIKEFGKNLVMEKFSLGKRAGVLSEQTSTDMADFNPSFEFNFGTNVAKTNGWVAFDIKFEENDTYQFPVYDDKGVPNESNIITYNILEHVGVKPSGEDAEPFANPLIITETQSGTLYRQDAEGNLDKSEVWGTFTIEQNGDVAIMFNEKVRDKYKDCKATLSFNAKFRLTQIEEKQTVDFTIDGKVEKSFEIEPGLSVSARKGASEYRPADGGFLFTIQLDAETVASNVTITDTLGAYLTFDKDSFSIVDENDQVLLDPKDYSIVENVDGFVLTINNLPADTYFIKYIAKLSKDAVLDNNGKLPDAGLTNSAVIKIGDEEEFEVKGNAKYYHEWINKTSSYNSADKIAEWTITVNPGAEQDPSGMTVYDELKSDNLTYDKSNGIRVIKSYLNEQNELVTVDPESRLEWEDVINTSQRGWEYTIPDEPVNYQYTFIYYTKVGEPNAISEEYYNAASVGSHSVNANIIVNKNDFASTQSVEKTFEEQININGIEYAKWTSQLVIPAGTYEEDLVLTDTLYGPHKLPVALTMVNNSDQKVPGEIYFQSSNIGVDKCDIERVNDTSFIIKLKALGEIDKSTITLTYYTELTGAGTISNANDFQVNGKVQSSVGYGHAEEINVKKSGVYNPTTGRIVWTVNLGKGYNSYITLVDTFPNQTYYQGSFKVYNGNTPVTAPNPSVGADNASFTVMLYLAYQPTANYRVVYETTPNRSSGVEAFENTVKVSTSDGKELGGDSVKIKLPSDVFDKSVLYEPSKANGYKATFSMLVNEGGMKWPETALDEYTYVIEDTLGDTLRYEDGSIRVYEGKDENGRLLEPGTGEGKEYVANCVNQKLSITIKGTRNANGTGKTYYIVYNATVVSPDPDSTQDVEYTNTATATLCGQKEEDVVKESVEIEAKAQGGVTGTRSYFYINKKTTGGEPVPGAKFQAYRVNDDGTETEVGGVKTVPESGKVFFGQDPDETVDLDDSIHFMVKEGQRYILRETYTPDGYISCNEIKIAIGQTQGEYTGYELYSTVPVLNQKKITKKVEKIWNDQSLVGDEIIANRPDKIEVELYRKADGSNKELAGSGELTASNDWKYEWTELPETDENGNVYDYTVKEINSSNLVAYEVGKVTDDSKSTDKNTFKITNKLQVTKVEATKTWDDVNDQDGIRNSKMSNVAIQLYMQLEGANEVTPYGEYQYVDLTRDKTYSWNKLPVYFNGKKVTYSVKEGKVINGVFKAFEDFTADELKELGYESTVEGFSIKNTHIPQTTEITIKKEWEGEDDYTGNRPSTVKFELWKSVEGEQDEKVGEASITDTTTWQYKWKDLPVYEDGKPITYKAKEVGKVNDYEPANDALVEADGDVITLVNNYIPEKTFRKVVKVWDDNNNADGLQPSEITATLQVKENNSFVSAGTVIKNLTDTVKLDKNNDWSHIWKDLPVRLNGKPVEYQIVESGEDAKGNLISSSYTGSSVTTDSTIDNIDGKVITITNSRKGEETSVIVEKVWDDGKNQGDGNRPAEIRVTLYSKVDGGDKEKVKRSDNPATLTTGSWTKTWSKLPKNAGGKAIEYTVEESLVGGGAIVGYTLNTKEETVDGGKKITLTNSYKPAYTSASVKKIWEDDDNKANKRPASIQVQLKKSIGGARATNVGDPVTLDENNGWYHYWGDKLLARENGETVTYTVEELTDGLPEGYSKKPVVAEVTDEEHPATEYAYSVTNTFDSEKTSITAQKIWDDDSNRDGKRWPSVKLKLYADGVAVSLEDREDAEVVLTAANQQGNDKNTWSYTWTGLEMYRAGAVGEKIVYTVKEIEIPEDSVYDKPEYSEDKLTVTNSYIPKKKNISVQKIWDDAGDQDGKRPATIKIKLLKNGVDYEEITLTDTKLSHTWENLPVYENGKLINYTVKEVYQNTELEINGYKDPQISEPLLDLTTNTYSYTITNSYIPETVDKTVTKFWDDDGNRDLVRPYSVLVQLYRQVGNRAEEKYSTKTDDGERELTGTGTESEWTAEWKNLPKYEAGEEIVYTVKEVGYRMSADGDKKYEAIPGYDEPSYSKDSFRIENHRDFDTVAAKVVKDWDDADNHDKMRPDEIVLQLYKYVEGAYETTRKEYGLPVTVTDVEDAYPAWTYEWKDLPKYANVEGVKKTLKYEVEEIEDKNYEYVTITPVTDNEFAFSFKITNKHELEKVQVEFTKNWYDNSDQDGMRPTSIWLQLYRQPEGGEIEPIAKADGGLVEITDNAATPSNIWYHKWENLPKYQWGGAQYTYTVAEGTKDADGNFISFKVQSLDGYTAGVQEVEEAADGSKTIKQVNKHETKKISVNLIKSWVEDDSKDRPDKVEFTLMQSVYDPTTETMLDPVKVEIKGIENPITLSGEADKWVYTWKNLPRRANGKDIVYTVEENKSQMNGYSSSMTTAPGLVELKNTKVEETTITVNKIWDDHEDVAGLRPETLSAYLYADGRIKDIQELNEANGWTYTWSNLPVYNKDEQGKPEKIKYSVKEGVEGKFSGYELTNENVSEDGLTWTFTNSYNPTVEKTVTKVWQDNNNQDGLRLPEIFVGLYADDMPYTDENGKAVVKAVTGDMKANEWTYTWKNLPKYSSENTEIKYSVRELKYVEELDRYEEYQPDELKELGYTQIKSDDPMELINEHKPVLTKLKVNKIWDDANDIAGLRESIGIRLLANGKLVDFQTLSEDNEWTYTWTELPLMENGTQIIYTVEEVMSQSLSENYTGADPLLKQQPVLKKSYENIINELENKEEISKEAIWEYDIKNTYIPETIEKTVTKNWVDNDDQDGIRPKNTVIQVQLYADGKEMGKPVELKEGSWSYIWTDLPKYRDKANLGEKTEEIEYTVKELTQIDGYEASVTETKTGFEINNYHRTEKTSYGVVKYWVDNGNTGRPKEVKFQLYAKKYNAKTDKWETEAVKDKLAKFTGTGDRWQYIWSDLETMHNGKEIEYSVEEVDVATGYTVTYQKDDFMTYATNTNTTTEFSKTDITGTTELPGATLQVVTGDGKEVLAQWTSTTTPRVIKGLLEAGKTYILREIAAPAGYAIADPVKFTTNADGKIQKVIMKDAKTNISILKVDDQKKPLAGAELAIKDSKGTIIEQWTSTDKAHVIEGKLNVGEKYTLTEIKAPLTYFLAKDIPFTVPANGIVELTMVDSQEESVGKISATKKVTVLDDAETVEYKVANDVTFYMALFKDAEGKERYTEYDIKEVVVKEDRSVSEAVTWDKLPSGTYYVFETDKSGKAIPLSVQQTEKDEKGNAYRYICVVAEGTTNKVELSMQQKVVEGKVNLENAYFELPNHFYKSGQIDINKKVLRNGSAYNTNTEFYAGVFTKDEAGDYIEAEILNGGSAIVTLKNNGTVTVDVPLGGENKDGSEPITYYVMETDKYGDPLDTDVFAYEISGEGSVTLTEESTQGTVTITNEARDNTTELDILKVDENDNPLAGAAFTLTYRDANVTAGKWTSTTAARTMTLIPGTYTLSELQAPTGYIKGSDATIIVAKDGTVKVTGDSVSYKNGIVRFVNKKSGTPTSGGSGTTTRTNTTSGSGTSGGGVTNTLYKAGSVKTGDETPVALYLIIFAGAVALAGSVIFIKRRKKSK